MRNKIILLLAAAMLIACLSACQNAQTPPDVTPAEDKTPDATATLPKDADQQKSDSMKEAEQSASGWGFSINTLDLYGNPVTNEAFADNKLTIINVWATWCPPCVAELPELQKASETFADKGVQIVGVLQDGVAENGKPSEEIIATALELLKNAEADYLVVLPDAAIVNEFVAGMQYFPTTFFVDEEGNVVNTVIGANSFEDWSEQINETLELISQS